jgi:hypothetical protein
MFTTFSFGNIVRFMYQKNPMIIIDRHSLAALVRKVGVHITEKACGPVCWEKVFVWPPAKIGWAHLS